MLNENPAIPNMLALMLKIALAVSLLFGWILLQPAWSWANSVFGEEVRTHQTYDYEVVKTFLPKVDNVVSDLSGGFYLTLESPKPKGKLIHLSHSGVKTILLSGLDKPDGLRMKHNKLYITEEVKNGRFIEYGIETKTTRTITTLNKPEGLTSFSDDSFLITEDISGGRLVEVKLSGEVTEILGGLSRPESVVVDNLGVIYFTETDAGRVSKYSKGEIIPLINGLNEPDQLAIDAANNLWIGEDSNPARLLQFRQNRLVTVAENLVDIQGILALNDQLFVAEQGRNRLLRFYQD